MLKSYDELRKLDLSQYIEKRDNIDYINSEFVKAICKDSKSSI